MKDAYYEPRWFKADGSIGFVFLPRDLIGAFSSPIDRRVCFCQANYSSFAPHEKSYSRILQEVGPCPIHRPSGHPHRTADRLIRDMHIHAHDRDEQCVFVPLVLRKDKHGGLVYDIDSLRIFLRLGLDLNGYTVVQEWIPKSLRPEPPFLEQVASAPYPEGSFRYSYSTDGEGSMAATAAAPFLATPAPTVDDAGPRTIRVVKAKRSSVMAHQVNVADVAARLANVVPRV